MNTILVSDIFGYSHHLEELAKSIGKDVKIIDPYLGKEMNFSNESSAYDYFISSGGVQSYSKKLKSLLFSISEETRLIGFSAGASAIWCSLDNKEFSFINSAICFYGSQIRHFSELSPLYPTTLIFSQEEEHFSVFDLINKLKVSEHVKCIKTPYYHGFMNKLSCNFNLQGYTKYINFIGSK